MVYRVQLNNVIVRVLFLALLLGFVAALGWVSSRHFIVRTLADVYSNWRANESLDGFLRRQGIPGISGVDTRSLTRRLRHA